MTLRGADAEKKVVCGLAGLVLFSLLAWQQLLQSCATVETAKLKIFLLKLYDFFFG